MRAGKVFRKCFVVILSCCFAIFILLVMNLYIAKTMLNKDNIYDFVKDADIFSISSKEILTSSNEKTLKESIEKDLSKLDIPVLVTDRILSSKGINNVITDYFYDYMNYVLFGSEKRSISGDRIMQVIQTNYYSTMGKNLTEKQIIGLESYVSSLCKDIDSFTLSEIDIESLGINLNTIRTVSVFIFSSYMLILSLLVILVVYILFMMCLGSFRRTIKWIGNIVIFDGIIMIILSFLEVRFLSMFINSKGIVNNLAISIVGKSYESLLLGGIVLLLIGIILLIISSILLKKENKEKSNKLLNDVIISENNKSKMYDKIDKVALEDEFENVTSSVSFLEAGEIPLLLVTGDDKEDTLVSDIVPDENILIKDNTLEEDTLLISDEENETDQEAIHENKMEDNENEGLDTSFVLEETEEDEMPRDEEEPLDISYEELANEDDDIEIIKSDRNIFMPNEISPVFTSPKKGKDIKVELLDDEEDEEIELL